MIKPNIIFELSWEVCNKVGGIYTVLASRAKTLLKDYPSSLFFIGPDLKNEKESIYFQEDLNLLKNWKEEALKNNLPIRIGRWKIDGNPIAILIDFSFFYSYKDKIYTDMWNDFKVDSLHAYGDYDESSIFSYSAGVLVKIITDKFFKKTDKIIFQAHEWMSGMGMLYIKKNAPQIATIFTTHATSIGRSIAGNNKLLYKYFKGYNGDQMASELHMESKHSIEKQSAHYADCFTTVSAFTDKECEQLLDKKADIILPNGFDDSIVPNKTNLLKIRNNSKSNLLNLCSCLLGEQFNNNSFIVTTSGRNDYRCKGFDVFMESLSMLNKTLKAQNSTDKVIALVEVPCWTKEPRKDLYDRIKSKKNYSVPLDRPYITHNLYYENEDRILNTMFSLGLTNKKEDLVKVILIPCYLDGADGIINLDYYDVLIANDLSIYPSYYEPWGYTPLEASAFHVPCITTDLSGYGQWVSDTEGYNGTIEEGVEVIHRDDDNYFEVAEKIMAAIIKIMVASDDTRELYAYNSYKIAQKAQWSNFIKYYYAAYDWALSKKNLK